jgi:DNA invertase Pin-like site-specific DNA recombinase
VKRVVLYARSRSEQPQTEPDLLRDLHRDVERRGDAVVGNYCDGGHLAGRGKNAGWRKMLANLDGIDQIVVGSIGDLPGRKVDDLLAILAIFRERGVGLRVHREAIDTGNGSEAVLDLIAAYRRTRLSLSIKAGQERARASGKKKIGRPKIPTHIQHCIQIALKDGAGIRPTAKKYGVSPGSVANIRRTMLVNIEPETLAA